MASLSGVDLRDTKAEMGFSILPAGKYLAAIVGSEIKNTKDGKGRFAEFKFQVVNGEYRGKTVFTRLNLWNAKPEAVRMAKGELKCIEVATGIVNAQVTEEYHNIPVVIEVAVEARKDKAGEFSNRITGYEKRSTAPAQEAATAPAANGSTPPWERPAAQ